eukprot:TRINITY_DN1705_c0_g1_i1.p1 TRINITY_DN1705_c0_g1~~TRINITY_DN1705_c0_g1_i1.p1  ORF type:complete len:566 (+),score=132.84 TRINITY_DN1705_c0_g1_i1:204-1901(+)
MEESESDGRKLSSGSMSGGGSEDGGREDGKRPSSHEALGLKLSIETPDTIPSGRIPVQIRVENPRSSQPPTSMSSLGIATPRLPTSLVVPSPSSSKFPGGGFFGLMPSPNSETGVEFSQIPTPRTMGATKSAFVSFADTPKPITNPMTLSSSKVFDMFGGAPISPGPPPGVGPIPHSLPYPVSQMFQGKSLIFPEDGLRTSGIKVMNPGKSALCGGIHRALRMISFPLELLPVGPGTPNELSGNLWGRTVPSGGVMDDGEFVFGLPFDEHAVDKMIERFVGVEMYRFIQKLDLEKKEDEKVRVLRPVDTSTSHFPYSIGIHPPEAALAARNEIAAGIGLFPMHGKSTSMSSSMMQPISLKPPLPPSLSLAASSQSFVSKTLMNGNVEPQMKRERSDEELRMENGSDIDSTGSSGMMSHLKMRRKISDFRSESEMPSPGFMLSPLVSMMSPLMASRFTLGPMSGGGLDHTMSAMQDLNAKCDLPYSHDMNVKRLQRGHTAEKPFICDFPGCEKTFARRCDLLTHKRTHTGERPYECTTCGKRFTTCSNLRRHEKTHKKQSDTPLKI